MNAKILLLMTLPALVAATAGFMLGKESGRHDAFTRGVVQGYIESLQIDLEFSSDGGGGIKLPKEKVDAYNRGLKENAEHMRLEDYKKYYDTKLFKNHPTVLTP